MADGNQRDLFDSSSEDERVKRQRLAGEGVPAPLGVDLKEAIKRAVGASRLPKDVYTHLAKEC